MKLIKKKDKFSIKQKNSSRNAVRDEGRNWLSGEDKVAVLLAEKLIKIEKPKKKAEEAETAAK